MCYLSEGGGRRGWVKLWLYRCPVVFLWILWHHHHVWQILRSDLSSFFFLSQRKLGPAGWCYLNSETCLQWMKLWIYHWPNTNFWSCQSFDPTTLTETASWNSQYSYTSRPVIFTSQVLPDLASKLNPELYKDSYCKPDEDVTVYVPVLL